MHQAITHMRGKGSSKGGISVMGMENSMMADAGCVCATPAGVSDHVHPAVDLKIFELQALV